MVNWNNLPSEIKLRMLEEQVNQTGIKNEQLFIDSIERNKRNGGFDWGISKEGMDFWTKIIREGDIKYFYTKYPHIKIYELW